MRTILVLDACRQPPVHIRNLIHHGSFAVDVGTLLHSLVVGTVWSRAVS